MADAVATYIRTETTASFAAEHLASLARTFDGVDHPVWIHDSDERCLYINAAARRLDRTTDTALRHEIVDHADRVVGRLTVAASRTHPGFLLSIAAGRPVNAMRRSCGASCSGRERSAKEEAKSESRPAEPLWSCRESLRWRGLTMASKPTRWP